VLYFAVLAFSKAKMESSDVTFQNNFAKFQNMKEQLFSQLSVLSKLDKISNNWKLLVFSIIVLVKETNLTK